MMGYSGQQMTERYNHFSPDSVVRDTELLVGDI